MITVVVLLAPLRTDATPAAPYPTNPTLTESAVYIVADGLSRFELATVDPTWHVHAGSASDAPVVAHDTIVVGDSRGLWAFGAEDGRLRWRYATTARAFSPTTIDNIVYAGTETGLLQALSVADGRVLWQQAFEGWVYPPAIVGDVLIVTGQNQRVVALDRHTGKKLWSRALPQESVYVPVAIDDKLVVVTTFSGDIIALHIADGALHWQQRDSVANLSPIRSASQLFFRTIGGTLKVRDAQSGKLQWQNKAYLSNHPVHVSNGYLAARDDAGNIAIFNTGDGRIVWHHSSHAELIGRPLLLADRLIFFTAGAYPTPTVVRWSTTQN